MLYIFRTFIQIYWLLICSNLLLQDYIPIFKPSVKYRIFSYLKFKIITCIHQEGESQITEICSLFHYPISTSENITKFLVVYLSSVILARFQDVALDLSGRQPLCVWGKPSKAGRWANSITEEKVLLVKSPCDKCLPAVG